MKKKVIWNFRAESDYWNNIDHLQENWSEKEVLKFIEEVDHLIKLLESGTVVFKRVDRKNIHVIPVVKQIKLFYQYHNKDTIELLRFRNSFISNDGLKY